MNYLRRKNSTAVASVVMLAVSAVLIWLPVLGPLISGLVGGRIAGQPQPALRATILPAFVVGFFTNVLMARVGLPGMGVLSGPSLYLAVLAQFAPLILGALLGAYWASRSGYRSRG